jgi:aminopeptidase N
VQQITWTARLAVAAATLVLACTGAARGAEEPAAQPESDQQAGGPLRPEQAAFDVRFYRLALAIDPSERSIDGTLTVRASIVASTDVLSLDLDHRLTVKAARSIDARRSRALRFKQHDGQLDIRLPRTYRAGELVEVEIQYGGHPRVAPRPPWVGGFTWSKTATGEPWIGVTCQLDGADLWWPVKDHPSDEPDDGMELHFTVPAGLTVVSNGRAAGTTQNANGTVTYHWVVDSPINAYDVTFNAAPFRALSRDYTSVTGRTFPVTYWVLPEDYKDGEALFPELLAHFAWLEKTLGPYPFQMEKYAIVETPYIAMEHQTNISYGRGFGETHMGFHYIPLHETGHEWWGNLVSASDWRDVWLQEAFTSYMEALYAEHLYGEAGYREYLYRYFRPRVTDRQVVAPEEAMNLRQAFQRSSLAKGALVLDTLRYLVGDARFFELLRRQAYPDATKTTLDRCPQCRTTTSADFVALATAVTGKKLDWFFDLYLRRPELPELEFVDLGSQVRVGWRVPTGMHFPMPIEISRNGIRERIEVDDGPVLIDKRPGDQITADPDFRVLRTVAPAIDRFGSRGANDPKVERSRGGSSPAAVPPTPPR